MAAKICLVLTEKTIEKNLSLLDKYRDYINIVELRADFLNQSEILYLREFPKKAKLPVILTVRRKSDGGRFTGGEGARMTIFARGLAFSSDDPTQNFAYVDLESDFNVLGIEEAARAMNIKIIRSLHSKTPIKNIANAIADLRKDTTDIPKLAFTANSLINVTEVFKYVTNNQTNAQQNDANNNFNNPVNSFPYIISVMGIFGIPTRVLATKIHSEIVYTFSQEYINKNKLANELIDPVTLKELYRFDSINEKTKIFGVIGKDVNSSLSPTIHNRGFENCNINSVYIPISAINSKEAIAFAEVADIQGLSITAPFKTEIIPQINSISDDSKSIGAVNTLIRKNKKWYGSNTDVDGFKQALIEFLEETNLHNYKIAIIGAGGAAKAVAHVIKSLKGKACIFNRTAEKAQQLAKQYGFKWAILDTINIKQLSIYSDLIIQTTTVGMEPLTELDPLSFYTFTGKEKIFDIIYRPETTHLLKRARAAGCMVCNGYKMLEYQAHHQFKAFANRSY